MPRTPRTTKGSRRSRRNNSMIEALEPRRLLTSLTVNGTPNSDDIQVAYHGPGGITGITYDFTVNGVTTSHLASGFGGNTITINGLSSGDDIWIKEVYTDDFVTVKPGQGDDTINVAAGSFSNAIHGTVTIEQQPNQGNDHLFIDDSTDGDTDFDVNGTSISAGDGRVVHNSLLASVLLKVNDSPPAIRNVYVDESVPNMTIDMGGHGGASFVSFAPHDHILESFAVPMTIIGSNYVRFFDSAGPGGRTFDITPTSAFGKTMIDVQEVAFIPREDPIANGYTFNITGGPAGITSLFPCSGTVNVGSSDAPLDLANLDCTVFSQVRGATNIFDAGLAQSSPFLLSGSTTQNVSKGDFALQLQDANVDLRIRESDADTVFNISQLVVDSQVVINSGGGDDILQTVNANNHQFDLDAIFLGDLFFFDGGGGDNLLDLNDSHGNTQFGNPTYRLQRGKLIKNGQELLAFDAPAASRINWVGSSDNDQMFFAGAPGNRVTLNGGAGNDLFSTFDSDFGGGNLPLEGVGGLVIGGTGFDAITIDDTAAPGALDYALGGSSSTFNAFDFVFQANGRSQAITFTSDIESMQIFEGSGSATTHLNSKPTTLQMTVGCGAGNDTIVGGGGDIDSNGWRFTSLSGDAGVDRIEFDDHLDAPNFFGDNSENETMTLENQSLRKGPAGFAYNGFERQIIIAGNGESDVFGVNNVFDINVIPTGMPTSIFGGTFRASTINVAASSGDLDTVLSELGVFMGPIPGSELNVMDQNETGTMNYTLGVSQLTRTVPPPGLGTKTIFYGGLSVLRLNASRGGNKKIVVTNTPAGMATTINSNFSATAFNSFTLGGGNVSANLLGPITVNASGGASNGVVFDNSLDTNGATQTLNGGVFTDGRTHTMNNASTIFIQNSGGGGTLDIPRVTTPTFVSGGAPTVTIGGGNLDANLLASINVDGASSVTVDDRLDTGNDGYVIDAASFRKTNAGAPTVTIGLHDAAILQCNNADNVITVNNCSTGVQVFGNGGNDRFDVLSTKPNFLSPVNTLGIDTGAENISVSPFGDTVNISGNSSVQLLNNDTIRSLSVSESGAKFIIPTGVTCKVQALTISGVIDMAGGALLSTTGGPSQATIRTLITRGYNSGGWNGTNAAGAINSSLAAGSSIVDAVGYGLGSQIAPTSIGGFAINAGDTLIRYTLGGDADLNGGVDLSDFTRLAGNFNGTGKVWSSGDFDYDGTIGLTDFTILAGNFNRTIPAAASRVDDLGSGPTVELLAQSEPVGAILSFGANEGDWVRS